MVFESRKNEWKWKGKKSEFPDSFILAISYTPNSFHLLSDKHMGDGHNQDHVKKLHNYLQFMVTYVKELAGWISKLKEMILMMMIMRTIIIAVTLQEKSLIDVNGYLISRK